ncbi:KH domain-containing protein akap-1 [Prorops nasuta]|uniref:KH domain-containing protein akap-1 n=1 Tax=Prorops nasuta TaxID=863751 RepID=UPI0034CF9ECA
MVSANLQLVKWSFPAFALIIGLLWYKRRRVDRADPGGLAESKACKKTDLEQKLANDKQRKTIDNGLERSELSKNDQVSLHDSGIQQDRSFSQGEEITRTPRRVSDSLDIPARKSPGNQTVFAQPEHFSNENHSWYDDADSLPESLSIRLGSNPRTSCFDTMVRNRAHSSLESSNDISKKLEIIRNPIQEEEQKLTGDLKLLQDTNETKAAENVEQSSCKDGEPQEANSNNSVAQAQVLSERDSANHSPVSGVMEGSITDEARSEGSTDSGKGGSIRGLTKETNARIVYEFSIPSILVGKLIGRNGNFLHNIRSKADVTIVVKSLPGTSESRICVIEGSSEDINIALNIIRQRFPEKKYPHLTLAQISSVKLVEEIPPVPQLIQLSLVDGVNNDVIVCHILRPDRFFVQMPTHPTYPSLRVLDANMTLLYDTTESPPVPDQLSRGMICVAKWYDRWVRVYVQEPDPQGEQNLVRLVDHGGYYTFSNADMRKIRSDYLMLPFQAIEVFLANVQPKNGEWVQEACDLISQMSMEVIGQAQVEEYVDGYIYINLYFNLHKYGVISVADELVARGYAEHMTIEQTIAGETGMVS